MQAIQIFNTRPIERAAALSIALRQLGYQVHELPLLALSACDLDAVLEQQFLALGDADIIVVVSPIAAQLGVKYYRQLGLDWKNIQQKQWIAVGEGTQRTLAEYGLSSVCPTIETSEGMLALVELQDCYHKTIAFWRGIGGRTFMMQQLQQQGCRILNMLLYTRQQPENMDAMQTLTHLPAVILISSEASWNNWLKLCAESSYAQNSLSKNIYLVLGDRVSDIVQAYFAAYPVPAVVKTLMDLKANSIHHSIQQYLNYEQ